MANSKAGEMLTVLRTPAGSSPRVLDACQRRDVLSSGFSSGNANQIRSVGNAPINVDERKPILIDVTEGKRGNRNTLELALDEGIYGLDRLTYMTWSSQILS